MEEDGWIRSGYGALCRGIERDGGRGVPAGRSGLADPLWPLDGDCGDRREEFPKFLVDNAL